MSFAARWQDTALDETCILETGGAASLPDSETPNIKCMEVPPTDYEDDTILKLLIDDTNDLYDVGHRVVYNNTRYLINRVQRDGTLKLLMLKSWPEQLSS